MLIVKQKYEISDLFVRETTIIDQTFYSSHNIRLNLSGTRVQYTKVIKSIYHATARPKVILEYI